jgi:hypothetical protein
MIMMIGGAYKSYLMDMEDVYGLNDILHIGTRTANLMFQANDTFGRLS